MAKMKDKVLAVVTDEVKTQIQETVQDAKTTVIEAADEAKARAAEMASTAGEKVRETDAFQAYRAAGPDKRRLWIAIAVVGFCVLMAVLFGTRASASDCKPAFPTDMVVGCTPLGVYALKSESADDFRLLPIVCGKPA